MEFRASVPTHFLRDAMVTFAVVLLAIAAFDDITTDSDTSFLEERTMLVFATVWFSVVGWRLWQDRHRILGGVSLGLVAIGALAQPTIGQGPHPSVAGYLATLGTLAWFLIVAGILAMLAWRHRHKAVI